MKPVQVGALLLCAALPGPALAVDLCASCGYLCADFVNFQCGTGCCTSGSSCMSMSGCFTGCCAAGNVVCDTSYATCSGPGKQSNLRCCGAGKACVTNNANQVRDCGNPGCCADGGCTCNPGGSNSGRPPGGSSNSTASGSTTGNNGSAGPGGTQGGNGPGPGGPGSNGISGSAGTSPPPGGTTTAGGGLGDGLSEGGGGFGGAAPGPGGNPGGGGACAGDPVSLSSAKSYNRYVDFEEPGGLSFSRSHQAYGGAFLDDLPLSFVPKPFGSTPGSPNASVEWWHSAYALVLIDMKLWSVRDRDGALYRFQACAGAPCWAAPTPGNQSIAGRLQRTASGFVFWQPDGTRLVYEAGWGPRGYAPTRFFLSAVIDARGALSQSITYAQPSLSGGCPANGDGGLPGVPYVYEVSGPTAKLRLQYKRLVNQVNNQPECVVERLQQVVALADAGTSVSDVAVYGYVVDAGQERPGRIATADFGSHAWSYGYVNSFTESLSGTGVSQHAYTSSKVASVTGTGEDFSLSWNVTASGCQSGSDCCGETMTAASATDNAARRGDNGSGSTGFQRKYDMLPNRNQTDRTRLYQLTDSCTVAGSCSPGTYRYEWACTDGGYPGFERARKNKRDNWRQLGWAAVDAGMPALTLEQRSVAVGASSMSGADALESSAFTYVYGDGGQQLPSTTTRASVLSAGNGTVATSWHDASNKLTKQTRTGYSVDSSQSTVQKTVATFYSASRACGASAGPDLYGRTLEVRGPCFVSAESDTSCAAAHPVTVYEYYPDSELGPNRNRLYRARRYVNGSDDCASGTPLTTTYASYDGLGNAGAVTDESGNTTTYTFDARGRVTSRTTPAGHTTRFAYDYDKLTRVMLPEGDGEVSCYRTGGDSDCTTGAYTPQLQWKASKACTGTTGFSCTGAWAERVNYTWAADGTVSQQDFRACEPGSTCTGGTDGTLRRVLKFSSDAHKRSTWRGYGDAAGQYSASWFYDRADNLAGVGHAFNNPPAWCGGPNTGASLPDEPVSKLCATLRYDRAERLASMTEYPTTSASGQSTCFGYDAHGNVTAVHAGCAGASGCGSDGLCAAQGASKAAQYTYDDFGNLVFVELPWTSNGSGGKGRWLYVYDAHGHTIYRRSPEQLSRGSGWYSTFSFDMLGRPTGAVASTSSGAATLFTLAYDSASAPANCPEVSNAGGRLARREDALGTTFYAYDAEGHVTSETLLKPGQSQCLTSSARYGLTPVTAYTYTDNGLVKTLGYPQGRGVEYVYGPGAGRSRVASVKVQKREGGAWAWYTVLDNVLWEPYGGLRRYQGTPPPGGGSFTVEYRQGDNSEAAPMSGFCTASWSPGGDEHTGRLRALWVSAGQQALGGGSGELLRLWYQWRGEVPVRRDSCLLQESTPRTVTYAYDNLLELGMADGGYPSGPSGLAGYAYDARGNRTSSSQARASALTTSYSLASNGDLLNSLSRNDTGGFTRSYSWDKNGRPTAVAFGPNSGGADAFSFGYTAAESLTFSTLSIGGATYSYSYDAFNRRGSKQYPSSVTDDFYYDFGHQLLADRGVWDVASGAPYPVDDYVWLGGRAVVVAHGVLDSSWARQDDTGGGAVCQRNGEAQACGFYFPVTDHLSAPVLMLDSAARVTGTSEADAFGYPNRGGLSATTGAQPYSASQNLVLGGFQVANAAASTTTQVRARFAVLETEATQDYARLEEPGGATGAAKSGATSGPVWTDWLTLTGPSATRAVDVRFVSNASVQAAGVIAEAFEYRRFASAAATPFFTPLRFPGQYHDAESDLFENWNRYYDPFTGRYLQPEPLLQSPRETATLARSGHDLPTYSYALNNPLNVVDPTGNAPILTDPRECNAGSHHL